jgi:hypothetical protein
VAVITTGAHDELRCSSTNTFVPSSEQGGKPSSRQVDSKTRGAATTLLAFNRHVVGNQLVRGRRRQTRGPVTRARWYTLAQLGFAMNKRLGRILLVIRAVIGTVIPAGACYIILIAFTAGEASSSVSFDVLVLDREAKAPVANCVIAFQEHEYRSDASGRLLLVRATPTGARPLRPPATQRK